MQLFFLWWTQNYVHFSRLDVCKTSSKKEGLGVNIVVHNHSEEFLASSATEKHTAFVVVQFFFALFLLVVLF